MVTVIPKCKSIAITALEEPCLPLDKPSAHFGVARATHSLPLKPELSIKMPNRRIDVPPLQ
jgi:hypothetical protein